MLAEATNILSPASSIKGSMSQEVLDVITVDDTTGKAAVLKLVPVADSTVSEKSNATSRSANKEQVEPAGQPKMTQAERKKLAEAKALERERKRAQKEAELKQKEEEKERLRAAKEQDKAAKELEKQQKRAEKEKEKAEKEAEKMNKKAEKEASKSGRKAQESAKQAGFGGLKAMNRSKNLLMSFLKKDNTGDNQPKLSAEKSSQQSETSNVIAIDALDEKRAELDSHLNNQLSPCSLKNEFAKICQEWRSQRSKMGQPKGVPPTWSRKPNTCTDFQALAAQHYGDNVDLATVTVWRRKLLQYWDSQRPAYYGSYSKRSASVSGRRPFGREPTFDYEVMSDEDWEDEGDGESLASQDDEEDKEKEEDEEEDGFVVEDGHLSEDEGIVVMDENDEGVIDDRAGSGSGAAGARRADPQLQLLEGALDRARRSNRPLVLCSLPSIQYDFTTTLDPSVLSALSGTWLTPNIVIKPPRPAQQGPESNPVLQSQPKEPQSGQEPKSGAGRPRAEFPQQMLDDLLQFLGSTSLIAIDKVVTAFVSMHPNKGLSKRGVKLKLKEVASYSAQQHKWVIRQTVTGMRRTPSKRPNRSSSTPEGPASAKRVRISPDPAPNSKPTPHGCPASPSSLPIPSIHRFFKACPSQLTADKTTSKPTSTDVAGGSTPIALGMASGQLPSGATTPMTFGNVGGTSNGGAGIGNKAWNGGVGNENGISCGAVSHKQSSAGADIHRSTPQLHPPTLNQHSKAPALEQHAKLNGNGATTKLSASETTLPLTSRKIPVPAVHKAGAGLAHETCPLQTSTPHNLHPTTAQPFYTPNMEPHLRAEAKSACIQQTLKGRNSDPSLLQNKPWCSLVPESLATTPLLGDVEMATDSGTGLAERSRPEEVGENGVHACAQVALGPGPTKVLTAYVDQPQKLRVSVHGAAGTTDMQEVIVLD